MQHRPDPIRVSVLSVTVGGALNCVRACGVLLHPSCARRTTLNAYRPATARSVRCGAVRCGAVRCIQHGHRAQWNRQADQGLQMRACETFSAIRACEGGSCRTYVEGCRNELPYNPTPEQGRCVCGVWQEGATWRTYGVEQPASRAVAFSLSLTKCWGVVHTLTSSICSVSFASSRSRWLICRYVASSVSSARFCQFPCGKGWRGRGWGWCMLARTFTNLHAGLRLVGEQRFQRRKRTIF